MKSFGFHVLFACIFLALGSRADTFDPKELEHLAEVDGYGYKTANLILLKRVLKDVDGFKVRVPDFSGISSDSIQAILEQRGLDVSKEWSSIVSQLDLEHSLKTRTYPSWFIDASGAFARKIRQHLEVNDLGGFSNNDMAELQRLISLAKSDDWRLMVRSTGKEDTEKLANAGGNLSVANVSPELKSILRSIGQVVASYFEEKSLSQRLIAGDPTIIDKPLTPALIQRMVGERLNNSGSNIDPSSIPVGCVLYTAESAGRVADIHTLQCSFGHNEGVVQSLVPLDTFYLSGANVRSIIKVKPKRIAPVFEGGVFGLEEFSNPPTIKSKPSLSEDAARAISKVGDQIDQFYGKRMDIELVYEPSTKTIFIVQARPLVFPNRDALPSYLARTTDLLAGHVAALTSVEIGSASVQRITSVDQILLANTLDEALEAYTKKQPPPTDVAPHAVDMLEPPVLEDSIPIAEFEPPNLRNTVKVIIVAKQADVTSHAAAVFRGDSKTIYVSDELYKIYYWLERGNVDILIDGQRGLAVNIAERVEHHFDDRKLFESRFLKAGWINYPLPMRVSVNTQSAPYCTAPKTPLSLLDDFTCLVDRLQDEVKTLSQFVQTTRAKAHCNDKTPGCLEERVIAKNALPKLESLNSLAQEITAEMEKSPPADETNKLISLFPKRFLEALIYQKPDTEFVDAYSVESVKMDYQRRQTFVSFVLKPMIDSGAISDEILRDERLFLLAEKGSNASLTPETTARFIHLVDQLDHDQKKENISRFEEMIESLDHLGILPLWINSIFMQTAQRVDEQSSQNGAILGPENSFVVFQERYGLGKQNGVQLLNELFSEYKFSRPQLMELAEKKAQLQTYDVSRFERPERFEKNRVDLKNRFTNYFLSPSFLDFKTPLYQMAATSLMETFVERFDTSIKVLKSTRSYPNKVAHFKALLDDYFSILSVWSHRAPKSHLNLNPEWPLQPYLDKVQELLQLKIDLTEAELLPTPEFSVSGAALGSGANFVYYEPKTLEDLFTLIHQSLNAVMSAFLAERSTAFVLPTQLSDVLKAVYQTEGHPFPSGQTFTGHGESIRIVLTGISLDERGVAYSFNLPLRWHSAKIQIGYTKELDRTQMSLWILGESGGRWAHVISFCEVKSDLLKAPYAEPRLTEKEVAFTFSAANQIKSEDLEDIIIGVIDLTFDKMPSFESDLKTRPTELETLFDDYVGLQKLNSFAKAELIIEALLAKGKGVTRAEILISADFNSLSDDDQEFRFFVLEQLVKNGHSFARAESIVKEFISAAKPYTRFLAGRVLQALVAKDQAIEFAQQYALNAISEGESSVRSQGFRTLVELVRMNHTLKEAQNLIFQGLSSRRDSERYHALQILHEFVKRGLMLDEAESLIKPLLGNEVQYIQMELIRTSLSLLQNGKGLAFANEVARHFENSDDPWVRRTLEELRLALANAPKDEL